MADHGDTLTAVRAEGKRLPPLSTLHDEFEEVLLKEGLLLERRDVRRAHHR